MGDNCPIPDPNNNKTITNGLDFHINGNGMVAGMLQGTGGHEGPDMAGGDYGGGRWSGTGVPVPRDNFWKYAGENHVIDARDLCQLINDLAQKDFHEPASFSVEACRSLIAMSDRYQTGVLDYDEMCRLWEEVSFWRRLFTKYDQERMGSIETYQLQHVLAEIGVSLHLDTISALATRYGGKDRTLYFEDFVLCLSKTMSLYTAFKEYSESTPGEAHIKLDQWLKCILIT